MQWLKRIAKAFSRKEESAHSMKYLITGLGNMEPMYDGTRHNIGFDVADALAKRLGASFKHEQLGDLAEARYKGRSLILLKPSTYMNLSGKAVRHWLTKKKIPQERLLVIVDDLNLPFGQIRLRAKGGDGGHNGLKSINQLLGNNHYARLRIGIGRPRHPGEQVDYVLGQWTPEQKEQIPQIVDAASEAALLFVSIGLQHAMNKVNAHSGA